MDNSGPRGEICAGRSSTLRGGCPSKARGAQNHSDEGHSLRRTRVPRVGPRCGRSRRVGLSMWPSRYRAVDGECRAGRAPLPITFTSIGPPIPLPAGTVLVNRAAASIISVAISIASSTVVSPSRVTLWRRPDMRGCPNCVRPLVRRRAGCREVAKPLLHSTALNGHPCEAEPPRKIGCRCREHSRGVLYPIEVAYVFVPRRPLDRHQTKSPKAGSAPWLLFLEAPR
jgi:hypothetical protein